MVSFLYLWVFLPISISILFGLMAYLNLQQLAHYALSLVRRELDKQLTTMVLAQIFVSSYADLPFITVNTLQLSMNLNNDPVVKGQILMSYNITLTFSYLYYAVSINWSNFNLNFLFYIILESILHIYLCIRTISSSIDSCIIQDSSESMQTTNKNS